jgi:hypothetical protein
VSKPGKLVYVFKLNDENEGSDNPAEPFAGWQVIRTPLPPEDDKPWTIFEKPNPREIAKITSMIAGYHQAGHVVIWHCTHGRDRTSLVGALVGMQLFQWSKDQAWKDMIAHGFRWELPNLDAYWIENVSIKK